jgi:ketosteroid isomerase-like protein
MAKPKYADFEALRPYTDLVRKGLGDLVDGDHFFDTIAENALFEFLYDFPGWPREIRGRANLMDAYSGYGDNIKLRNADHLVAHQCQGNRIVILEYEVHGKILATGGPYDNRFVTIISIEQRKIVRWRDYMDSLAAWKALSGDQSQARHS